MDAITKLREGLTILEPLLAAHGFAPGPIRSGAGSGGQFASCEFRRGDRRLQLHFRHSLGLVEYQLGTVAISHEDLMWSVTGQHRSTAYPGFSNEPLDGFKHLAADLTQYAQDFLAGRDPDFIRHAERVMALKRDAPRIPL